MTGSERGATPDGGWVCIPGELAQVEAAVAALHAFLLQQAAAVDPFAFRMLCFEGLSNAVRHGCGSDPARRVTAILAVTDGTATLTIRDNGPGFDWQARRTPAPAAGATGGRGLWILRHYSDAVQFNAAGNQLTVTLHGLRPEPTTATSPALAAS